MNNTILAGIIVGGVVVAAASAIAVNSGYNPFQKYATVVSVAQAYDTMETPRVVCGDKATLAEAQAAAAAQTQGDASTGQQASAPQASESAPEAPAAAKDGKDAVPQCLTVFDTSSVEAGFDVTYELDGIQKVVRLDHEPGRRIPVEDGELVLSQS